MRKASAFASNRKPVGVPYYTTCHNSILTTGKQGSTPGQSRKYLISGVAIHEETHQIFMANLGSHRIEVFSETGEFLYQLAVGQLSAPWGIAIRGDRVYVSCLDHTVSMLSLNKMRLVRRIGSQGSNNGQFDSPQQLTTDPIGRVFIPDTNNNRICVYNPDLNHLHNITHKSISEPCNVKLSRDRLYVLSSFEHLCMHVFTLEGDELHCFIPRGDFDVVNPSFFCLDSLNNIVISNKDRSILVFSSEGDLLHTIEMFYGSTGVAVTPNGRIVCAFMHHNFSLRILY